MKRLLRSSVLLAACVGLWSCTSDSTGDISGTPTTLAASPSSLFLSQDSTKLVDVEVLDEQGGAVPATFSVVSLDPGVVVTVDDEFRPEYNAEGVLFVPDEVTKLRLNVTGTSAIVSTTVRVTSGDLTLDIPVKTMPVEGILATFSTITPGLGEEITVTSQTGLLFTEDTEVLFEGFDNGIITNLAVDGTTLTFIAIPGTIGAPTFTNVALAVAPDITFDLTATISITAEAPPASIPAVFSTTTPAGGEAVTVSAAGWHFLPTSGVVIAGFTATNAEVAADGSSLTFLPRPGSSGIPNLVGIEIEGVSGVPITVAAEDNVTVGAVVTPLVGTDDPTTAPLIATPDAGGVTGFMDAGTFPGVFPAGDCELFGDGDLYRCQWYRFDVTTPGDLTFSGRWENTADLGVYIADASFAFFDGCDSHGNGATSQPETCTVTFDAAGTYYIGMATFAEFYPDPDPAWFTVEIRAPAP